MQIKINYYSPLNTNDVSSVFNRSEYLASEDIKNVFEQFYDMNNSMRYCYGKYYEFDDANIQNDYNNWYKGLTINEQFSLYYKNSTVD